MSKTNMTEQGMATYLLIAVRLHQGRYHGTGDHPPAPARLFQALVAGAGLGGPDELNNASTELEWLEALAPPVVASPVMTNGQRVKNYVPNNDLDAKGGDPRRIGEIRTDKVIRARLFDSKVPLLYVWTFDGGERDEFLARAACDLSKRLYQFGRGVDMAWAWGELIDELAIEERLLSYPGQVFRPSNGGNGIRLACPTRGSLASLVQRHAAGARRFTTTGIGKQLFTQQPRPCFVRVSYESPPTRHVFELRVAAKANSLGVWPLAQASKLVVLLRDGAVERLRQTMPNLRSEIERFLVGRKPDGADAAPTASRIGLVPLPSIGHQHADHGIRRLLVEVPAGCPLRSDDVRWAFSGLEITDQETGEAFDLILVPVTGDSMVSHYCESGDNAGFRVWRTITPAALPEGAKRRRINPTSTLAEAKNGLERQAEHSRAAHAVGQALRHARITPPVEMVRVQREPFESRGEQAEVFALGTRFDKHRLWHVELTLGTSIRGPLVIGDGRFMGLGVMAPLKQRQEVHTFLVEAGLTTAPDPSEIARALRRAVMTRVQAQLGPGVRLPAYFSGHEPTGAPAYTAAHLAFAFDPHQERLLVLAPHTIDRQLVWRNDHGFLETLERALARFHELRAGAAGLLRIRSAPVAQHDPLFAASRSWESVTPYQVTRHRKNVGASEALSADLLEECRRRGLPDVRVTPNELRGVPGIGLVGRARLDFEVCVAGPIMLGRSRHLGGGLFARREVGQPQCVR